MTVEFEELDFQETPLGDISLRRRSELRLAGKIVYEVKLGDEFLMSSLFTDAEIQLARLGLAALEGTGLDVVVGGLGLGYTAAAVLEDPSVASLMVVEVMEPVIDWHRRGLPTRVGAIVGSLSGSTALVTSPASFTAAAAATTASSISRHITLVALR